MKKIFKLTLLIFAIFILVGCGDEKRDDAKFHYKPEIFKHDSVITNTSSLYDEVSRDMIEVNVEGKTNEEKLAICQNNLGKLENQLIKLEDTRKLLKDEPNLTKDEKALWESNYKSSINAVKEKIDSIKTKALKYMETEE